MQKTILALQLPCELGDKKSNMEKVEALCLKLAKELGKKADFLFLPELWSVGWLPEIFEENAEDEEGETVSFLKNLAIKLNTNIIGGSYVRRHNGKLYNSIPVINRLGELLGHYDKNHLFALDGEAKVTEPGEKLLHIEIEGIKIGLSICYDIRFPELFRFWDAESSVPYLFVNLAAWPKTRKEHYTILSKARAVENQAYFLGLSQCGEIKNNVFNAGGSILVDPFGETIEELDENQGIIFKTIDTKIVDKIRETYPNLRARREYSL